MLLIPKQIKGMILFFFMYVREDVLQVYSKIAQVLLVMCISLQNFCLYSNVDELSRKGMSLLHAINNAYTLVLKLFLNGRFTLFPTLN